MARRPKNTCLLCLLPIEGGRSDCFVCSRPKCRKLRDRIYWMLRKHREDEERAGLCRWCSTPALPGSKFCGSHQYLKTPCKRCSTGRVRRSEGNGNQNQLCEACKARPARQSPQSEVSHGA